MGQQQGNAFVTTKKGVCYLTLKCDSQNFHISRIYDYTVDADQKRRMRKLYPNVTFDWKKIEAQLAEKRNVCRRYRSRRRSLSAEKRKRHDFGGEPFLVSYDPLTRTVYTSGAGHSLALLDAVLSIERRLEDALPSLQTSPPAKPHLHLAKK